MNTSAATVAKLRAQLQGKSGSSGRGSQILRVDEADLNALIDQQLTTYRAANQTADRVLRDLKVKLVEDRMRVYLTFDIHGAQTTLVIEGKLHSRDGYMDFEPTNVQVGALPIPSASVAEAFRQVAESPKYHEVMRLPANVSEIYLANGELVSVYK